MGEKGRVRAPGVSVPLCNSKGGSLLCAGFFGPAPDVYQQFSLRLSHFSGRFASERVNIPPLDFQLASNLRRPTGMSPLP